MQINTQFFYLYLLLTVINEPKIFDVLYGQRFCYYARIPAFQTCNTF